MSEFFIYPLGLLGLTAIPIVILIYLLRSRYKTKSVSSTFIWKRSLKYVKRRIPLNFIMSLLLILQILIVIVASFAIARPTVEPFETEDKIIILDASASMLASDGETTRFEAAKKKIEEAAEEIGENHKMTLILANESVVMPVISRTADKGEFLSALRPLECSMHSADMDGALSVAASVLNENAGATIQIYTDKTYIDTDGIEIIDCKRDGEWNGGIISFEENEVSTGKSWGHEFVANIGNYGLDSGFSVKLLIDGEVVAQRTVNLAAGEILQIRFTHSTTSDTGLDEIRVKLNEPITSFETATVELSANDSFGYDNSMTIYPREKVSPKIMYVSKYVVVEGGKKNANKSLLNIALRANGFTIESDDMYNNVDEIEELKGYDLYIFEGITPYYLPEDGAIWLIDAQFDSESKLSKDTGVIIGESMPENIDGYKIEKSLSLDIVSEIVENVDIDIPLTIFGESKYAAVSSYRPIISKSASFKPVYQSNGQDVLIAGNYNSAPMIVSTFDFAKSSLILYVSDFPILIKNMISYSVPDLLDERTAQIGSQIEFYYPAGAKTVSRYLDGKLESKVDVVKLTAELHEAAIENPELVIKEELKEIFEITAPGKYEIVITYPDGDDEDLLDDEKTYVITGHVATEETVITQRIPTESLKYPELSGDAVVDKARVEIFPYVVALLILLVIIEWGVYYREQY